MSNNGEFVGRYISVAEYDYYFEDRIDKNSLKIGEICVYSTLLGPSLDLRAPAESSKVIVNKISNNVTFNGHSALGIVVSHDYSLVPQSNNCFCPESSIKIFGTDQFWTKGYFRDWDDLVDGQKPEISTENETETDLIIPVVEPVLIPA